jgi:NRAMP (natural resistance-associated macrophage protein)-like metal ion transporter
MADCLPEDAEAQDPSKPIPWYRQLGPGLITGVSDDDPSGIATYAQTGARFGYGMLWTLVVSYPLMVSIQLISARIGRVTGAGIAANVRQHLGKRVLYPLVALLLIANTINIGADVLAMGDAVRVLIGGPVNVYCALIGLASLLLQVFVPYSKYVRFLKWLTLALLAYVVTVFCVDVDWREALTRTFWPRLSWDAKALGALTAILGTTISPYLFFWQASEEVEDQQCNPAEKPLLKAPEQALAQLTRIRVDTVVGMGCSNLVAFFIMLTTAATLHAHGQRDIETAAQAASALKPLAGRLSELLFALGIIGTGLLAIPVLAGSAAYAVGETFGWKSSLEAAPERAKAFYSIIALSTLAGVALDFVGFNPMKALVWAAVTNGVLAAPIAVVILIVASRKKIMGRYAVHGWLRAWGWLTAAVMLAAAAGMFLSE